MGKLLYAIHTSIKELIHSLKIYIFWEWNLKLLDACSNNNIGKVIVMMKDWRTDINFNHGNLGIWTAINGHVPIMKWLIKQKKFEVSYSIIRYAIVNNKIEIVDLLISNNIILNNARQLVNSALERNLVDIFKLLIRKLNNSLITYHNDFFSRACVMQYSEIAKFLIEEGSLRFNDIEYTNPYNYFNGVYFGGTETRIIYNRIMNSSVYEICRNGNMSIMKYMLNESRFVIDDGHIEMAANYNQFDIVRLILNHKRIDPSYENNKLLKSLDGKLSNHKKLIRYLLDDNRVREKLKTDSDSNKRYLASRHILPNYSSRKIER